MIGPDATTATAFYIATVTHSLGSLFREVENMPVVSKLAVLRAQFDDLWALSASVDCDCMATAQSVRDLIIRLGDIVADSEPASESVLTALEQLNHGRVRIALFYVREALDVCGESPVSRS